MAIFNPDVPDVKPQTYLGLSEPVKQMTGDTSTGELLKNLGDVGSSAIKVAHTLTKDSLRDEEYNRLTKVRDNFKGNLDKVYATLNQAQTDVATDATGGIGIGGGAGTGDDSIILSTPPVGEEPPKDIQTGKKRLTKLNDAKELRPDLLMSLDAQYEAELKDLRARFPGWRDDIDAYAKTITGRDSANDYIRQSIAKITSAVTASDANRNHVFNQMMSKEYIGQDGMAVAAELVRTGQAPIAYGLQKLSEAQRLGWVVGQQDLRIKGLEGNRKLQGIEILDQAKVTTAQAVTDSLDNLHAGMGFSTDPNKFVEAVKKGTVKQEDITELSKRFDIQAIQIKEKVIRDLKAKGHYTKVDAAEVNKVVDDQLAVHKAYISYLKDAHYEPAIFLAKANKADLEGLTRHLYNQPDVGIRLQIAEILKSHYGPNAMQALYGDALTSNLPADIKEATKGYQLGIAAGIPNPVTGGPANLQQDLTRIRELGITVPSMKDPRVAKSFIDMVEKVAAEDTPRDLKATYLRYMASPEGREWLSLIDRERIDPVTGKATNQRLSVYSRVVSKEFVDAAHKVGGEEWKMYRQWAEDAHGRELLRPDVAALKDVRLSTDQTLVWDNKDSRYGILDAKGNDMLSPGYRGYAAGGLSPFTKRTFNNINSGLTAFKRVAEAEGIDVNEYVFKHLNSLAGTQNVNATEMLKALQASHESNKKAQEELRKKHEKE